MPVLEVITPQATHRYPIKGNRFVLGRASTADAVITGDHRISREHCEVVLHKAAYFLRDLGSRNGTQVMGKPVKVVKLIDRGFFRIGSTFVRFFATAASAEQSPPTTYPKSDASVAALSVPGVNAAQSPAASPSPGKPHTPPLGTADDDEPIYDVAVLVDDQGPASPTATTPRPSLGASLDSIVALARVGTDPGFGIESLSLLNARGRIVHAAGVELTDATESLSHLQLLTLGAIRCNASDIHLEPKQHDTLIRLRVDGAMIEVCHLDADQNKKLLSLIKVLCDIDISRKSIIQEGHFSLAVPGRTIDYRVSFAPSMYGQKMVIRVLDPAQSPQQLDDLDMPAGIEERLRSTSQQSTGTVMVCGPTGSGKTTTLYAVLRQIDAGVRNVITIEDPIEYEVTGVTQIPLDSAEGHTFGNLLRSCLRQDPDVIVLGEVRDQDTAVTAMQAATTGHLVLSTIHANDTVSTVLRLLDLGVEPYLIASTLELVLAQRLVRKLCPACKRAAIAEPDELAKLGKEPDAAVTLYHPRGCDACFQTGYAGRVGVFELLTIGDGIRDVILGKPNLVELRKALAATGFQTLKDHAIERVLAGTTSLDDAHRMVGLG